MTLIDDLIEIWCLYVGWFCEPPPPPTPRTCGNINATDGNHEVFDCSRATNNIDDNPSQIQCDGGSCTAEMCCTTGSCHPQDYTGSLYGEVGAAESHFERNIHQNINDDINRRYDLTGISNDLDIHNWPQIFQCKAGYKNTHAYTEQLRSDTFAITNINNPADFENHFKVSCTNNQPLNFPPGSCAECDDSLGYFLSDRLPKLSSSGAVDVAGYPVCNIKSCNCTDSLGTWDYDGTYNPPIEIGTAPVGNDCPENGRIWCTSCNDGIDPIMVDHTNNIQIMSCLPAHRDRQRVINDKCETDELSLPINGGIDSTACDASYYSFVSAPTTCNFTCNPGYMIDNSTQPRCEVGGLGNWVGTQATCNPNTCTIPVDGSVPNYDVSSMACSNTSTGSITCETPATCEYPRADGSDNITYSCDADGVPLTLSGCESACNPSNINDPSDADIPVYPPPEPYVRGEGQISLRGTKCSITGSPVGPGEECDFTCPNQLLSVVQQPVCQGDGTWSSNVSPLCERISVDQGASGNCDISSVQAPSGGSLIDSQGHQNCGVQNANTSFYAVTDSGGKISDGQSCIMSCDNGSLPTDIPQCNNGVLSSQTGTCPDVIPTADYQMELSGLRQLATCRAACQEVAGSRTGVAAGAVSSACAAKIDNPEAREVDKILLMAQSGMSVSNHVVQYEIVPTGSTNYGTTGVTHGHNDWTWFVPWTITDEQSVFDACLSSSYLGTDGMIGNDPALAAKRCYFDPRSSQWNTAQTCANAQSQSDCESILNQNESWVIGCNWGNVSCDKLGPSDGAKECYEHCGAIPHTGTLDSSLPYSAQATVRDSSRQVIVPGTYTRRICNCYTGDDDSNCHQ
jgi:hypothetical protein